MPEETSRARKWRLDPTALTLIGVGLAALSGNADKLEHLGLPNPFPAPASERRLDERTSAMWREVNELRDQVRDAENEIWRLKILLERAGIQTSEPEPLRPQGAEPDEH